MKKKILSMILVALMMVSILPMRILAHSFTDVPEGAYFEEPVLWAVERGITSGTSATTFSPNMVCDRAQAVTFLWRAMDKPEPKNTEMTFTDVPEGSYYYEAVLWAVENGITSGTGGGKFSPSMQCDRSQIVTFLWRTMGCPASEGSAPFADVSVDAYYRNAVIWAVENAITSGTGGGYFSPLMKCDRAQIVTFLYRCFKNEVSELKIVTQPEEFYMRGSQEEVTFSIAIEGGQPNYYYEWVVVYDDGAKTTLHGATSDIYDEFTVVFTDYDFDNRNDIVVYCIVTDIEGTEITSERVSVYAKELYPHLTVVKNPINYYMESSQEDASFTVEVDGGFAPYSYNWMVECDGKITASELDLSDEKSSTFTHTFSDYDFDEYREINVYCEITDKHGNSEGETVVSNVAEVLRYYDLEIAENPAHYTMSSSQEDASFTVKVKSGMPSYRYEWYVEYDGNAVLATEEYSTSTTNTFTHTFSDYDFDDYRDIFVYCVVTDARGTKLTTGFAEIRHR